MSEQRSKEIEVIEEKGDYGPYLALFYKNARTTAARKYPVIQFGLAKAKAILASVDEIRAFVDKHETRGIDG